MISQGQRGLWEQMPCYKLVPSLLEAVEPAAPGFSRVAMGVTGECWE